jgi:hypothetical protein
MPPEIVKFPYSASRRVMSRRPRKSKNGTPEERPVKATAEAPAKVATVTDILGRNADKRREAKPGAAEGPTIVEFVQTLRSYLAQEFARGRNLDQIFDGLEESYSRLQKLKERAP